MYFTINSKKFNKRFLGPESSKSIKRIIGIATLQSVNILVSLAWILCSLLHRFRIGIRSLESHKVFEDLFKNSIIDCWCDTETWKKLTKKYISLDDEEFRHQLVTDQESWGIVGRKQKENPLRRHGVWGHSQNTERWRQVSLVEDVWLAGQSSLMKIV